MKRCLLPVLAWLVATLACAVDTPQTAAAGPPRRAIGDKTLVAWVYPANTTQRGGSLVTLQEGEDFDAVVLGERVPGRWMAGSDFFRRTQSEVEQTANAAETAGAKTLVQIAAVYAGNHVTIFRDGKPYAAYRIERPRAFAPDATILLGLRYLGNMGAIGFFQGALEEVRLYDAALDAKTMASLAPNRASDPRPIGLWSFEDGTANDSMKRFPPGQFMGGARIADGRLLLNGKDAFVMIAPPPAPQRMFFQSRALGGQWDTWLYYHQGVYYLYILAGPGGAWQGIGLATSPDGVCWTDRGFVLRKAEGVTWLGTGSTWKSPQYEKDKKFVLNFSEWRGDRQTIFFAESKDLVHWTRLGNDFEFRQDARWYKPNGRWDCIYTIPREGGGLFGYWTADPLHGPGVGFGQSIDGVRWEALKPPDFVDGAPHGECGALERIGEKYYMMLGAGNMKTLVADRPQGPFRPAKKNFVLLSGGTYFSRFFPTPTGLLVNHHSISRDRGVFFAPLKKAVVDGEGTLRLMWWEGNEKLKRRPVAVRSAQCVEPAGIAMLDGAFDAASALVVEGRIRLPAKADEPLCGLYIEQPAASGTAILVGPNGVTQFGAIQGDGKGFKADDRVDRQTAFGPTVAFRLLWKRSLVEFYLDDHLIQC
mgnify:CR=1 FL=1